MLEQRFGRDREESQALIAAARTKAEDSVELYSFTRTVSQHFDYDERTAMIEMLWEVVYADGELHDLEANLLRRVAGLLYVTDQESGAARSEEHTSELQSLMRISYAVFCLKK